MVSGNSAINVAIMINFLDITVIINTKDACAKKQQKIIFSTLYINNIYRYIFIHLTQIFTWKNPKISLEILISKRL